MVEQFSGCITSHKWVHTLTENRRVLFISPHSKREKIRITCKNSLRFSMNLDAPMFYIIVGRLSGKFLGDLKTSFPIKSWQQQIRTYAVTNRSKRHVRNDYACLGLPKCHLARKKLKTLSHKANSPRLRVSAISPCIYAHHSHVSLEMQQRPASCFNTSGKKKKIAVCFQVVFPPSVGQQCFPGPGIAVRLNHI